MPIWPVSSRKKSMAACLETFELKTNAALVFRSDLTTFSHYLTMSTVPQSTSPSLELCNKPRSHAACHISIGHGTGDLKGMSQGWVHLNSKSNSMTISYQYIYISYHLKYDLWPFSFLQLIFFIASRAEANVGGTQSITLRIQSQRTRLIWYLFCVPGSSIFSARQKCTSQVGVRRGHTTNQALNWQTHPLSRIVY